jgi:hypothetical protein
MEAPTTFMVARHGDRILAAGASSAMDRHLLRSLVVAPSALLGNRVGDRRRAGRLADGTVSVGFTCSPTVRSDSLLSAVIGGSVGTMPRRSAGVGGWSVACDKTAVPMAGSWRAGTGRQSGPPARPAFPAPRAFPRT